MASVNAGGGNSSTGARPSNAVPASGSRQQQSRKPPLQNGGGGSSSSSSSRTQSGQPHHHHHQSHNRPRFSPYTPPLSSAVPISSGRAAASARVRHATVSTDAAIDIDDPRIYPTELSSSRGQQEAQASAMSRSYDCTFFSSGASAKGHGRRGEFIIHPEWLSESVSIERLRINERPLIIPTGHHQNQQRQQNYQSQLSHPPSHYPNHGNQQPQQHQAQQHQLQQQLSLPADWPRRCKSAPPPPQSQHHQAQNPITWQ